MVLPRASVSDGLSRCLLVLLIAGGGIWGGAALQRSQGSPRALAPLAAASPHAFGSRPEAVQRGTGGCWWRIDSRSDRHGHRGEGLDALRHQRSGNLVEVTSSLDHGDAKRQDDQQALPPGDTVVVQGTKAKNGTVSASSVSATAPA